MYFTNDIWGVLNYCQVMSLAKISVKFNRIIHMSTERFFFFFPYSALLDWWLPTQFNHYHKPYVVLGNSQLSWLIYWILSCHKSLFFFDFNDKNIQHCIQMVTMDWMFSRCQAMLKVQQALIMVAYIYDRPYYKCFAGISSFTS